MPSWPTSKVPQQRQVLIFEPDAEGHSQEWLQHLSDYVAANSSAPAITVLAPPALCASLAAAMPVPADGRIRLIALEAGEARLCGHRLLSLAAFARWWTM